MPPLPRSVPGAARDRLERGVDLDDLLDERRLGVEARVGGEQAAGVGEQDEQVGADEVRHERGEPVVVAVADLVVGDGVVLVDDGHDAELEQSLHRLAGVEVLRAVAEVVRGEEHLARRRGRAARAARRSAPSAGAGRRRPGPAGSRCRAAGCVSPTTGKPERDGAGRHEHDPVPGGARPRRARRRAWPARRRRPRRRSS